MIYKKKLQLDVPKEFGFLRKTIKPFMNRRLTLEDINILSNVLDVNAPLLSRLYHL